MVETSNGKNCRTCNKAAVCKYQAKAVTEVEKLIETVKLLDLPFSININCKEYDCKINGVLR